MWEQTCVAAPAQQRSNRPKHRSSPNADEWYTDGVQADTVSYRNTQGRVAWIQLWSTMLAVWNVMTLANTGQKKGEALKDAAFLTCYECQDCDIYSTMRSFLILAAFANICNWKEPLLAKYTLLCIQEEKENQLACPISEQHSQILCRCRTMQKCSTEGERAGDVQCHCCYGLICLAELSYILYRNISHIILYWYVYYYSNAMHG